jgi:aspartate kinase
MEQVIRAKVPIRIKNTFKPGDGGTVILLEDDYEASTRITPIPPLSHAAVDPHAITATACTLKSDVLVLNIHSNRKSVSHGFLAKVFTCLDRYGVVVDLISTSEVHVSLVTSASSLGLSGGSGSNDTSRNSSTDIFVATSPNATDDPSVSPVLNSALTIQRTKLDMVVRELQHLGELSVLRNMVILSLVGKRMRNMVGIAGKMFSVLARENVNIEMISQGASEVNISCVVLESDAERALRAVHDHCVLGMDPR